jgi:hypothetical protein
LIGSLLGRKPYGYAVALFSKIYTGDRLRSGVSMTFVGVLGVLLGFIAFAWFSKRKDNSRLALFLMITILHVIVAYIYYRFVQTSDADTKLYYFDPYGFYDNGFALGTMFVVYVTQSARAVFGGSYLDYFFVYQALGVWGLALVFRTIEEIAAELGSAIPTTMIVLMFLPGMYFWTAAIGKDAPLFLACVLAVWSSFRLSSRWVWFGLAIAIMVSIRVHVALVTVVALALALVAGRGVPNTVRFALGFGAVVAGGFLFSTLQAELNVDLSSIGSIANYVDQQTAAATRGVDSTLANSSFPVKLLSLLYRPFFFDAGGIFGVVASIQNVVMVIITFWLLRNFRLWAELFRGSFAIRFATIHFVALYLMLAIMYYNVGLGLRQREMATPALLVVFSAVFMVCALRRRSAFATSPVIPQTGFPA